MKLLKYSLAILSVLFLVLTGCEKDKVSGPNPDAVILPGTVEYYFKQAKSVPEAKEKLDFLNKALAAVSNEKDTVLPHLLDFKIYYHDQIKEYDSALYFTDKLIEVAQFQKDTHYEAMAYYRKAFIYKDLKIEEKNFENHFKAVQFFLKINDSSMAGASLSDMAISQSQMTDYTGAQESATEALKYLNKNKDFAGISSAYNSIAIAYRQQGFYEDALTEYQNAIRYSTNLEDSLGHLNNMALVLGDQKKFKEAISLLERVVLKSASVDGKANVRLLDNLAFIKWTNDSTVNIEKDLLQDKDRRLAINDRNGLLSSYNHLSEYYLKKDKKLSKKYAEELLNVAIELNSELAQLRALRRLVHLSSKEDVRKYSEEYFLVNDSLNASNLRVQNRFAKIKFDEERKQQEIVGLKAQNTLHAIETQQLRTRSWIRAFVGILVILGLFFLSYYLRQRQKKHEIREVHKTESRISKVIHDELANDIFNIMSILEPVAPIPVIDKLEKIYMRTRDISRENREIDTGEDYVDYLKAILSNNTPDNSKLIVSGENSVKWNKLQLEMKIVIYRVLQELMINMKKHSGAKLVALSFVVKNKTLSIRYSDNGCGMLWNPSKKGSGLQNVENRISSLNGKITFESKKEKGFKVDMQIPV